MDLPDFSTPLSPASDFGEKFFSRKNIITFLLVGISLLVIPVGVKLVQEQQVLKSKATGNEVVFVPKEGVVECSKSGECVTKDIKVEVNLTSPFGEPGDLLPTATPTPTLGPTTPTLVPPITPAPASGCTVRYDLNPSSPPANTDVTVTFPITNSPNLNCVVLFQDGAPQACRLVQPGNVLTCTANSGATGSSHLLQLKYGQDAYYRDQNPRPNCGQEVVCNHTTYQTGGPPGRR